MPSHRGTWAEHGKEGWCTGPAKEHCQCCKAFVNKTKGIRIPPKVKFHPEKHSMPANSSTDRILQAAKQLTHAPKNPAPETPFEHVGDEEAQASNKLATIFQNKAEAAHNKDTSEKMNEPEQRVHVPEQRVPMRFQSMENVSQNNT